jgi:uncharacterized damage-inducible protein DinB
MTAAEFCKKQYELICDSRRVLFDYCQTISEEHFIREHSSFGRGGSIRNLLVHIANTYEFWIGKEFLKKEIVFTEYISIGNIAGVVQLFNAIDTILEEFFVVMKQKEDLPIDTGSNDENSSIAFQYFTHVITHEFHHKGQVLSLSRQLGYIPVDTDIMR